jgi:hypothetical protein
MSESVALYVNPLDPAIRVVINPDQVDLTALPSKVKTASII